MSLTILKANISTTSSHRSLANPLTEQDKELSEIQSSDNDKNQSSPFFTQRSRCPSVPLTMPSRIPEYPVSSHSRRSSLMSGSSVSSHGRVSPDRMRQGTISESDSRFLQEIKHLDEVLLQNSEKDSFVGTFSQGHLGDFEKEEKSKTNRRSYLTSAPSQPARSHSYMSAVISQRYSYESVSNEPSVLSTPYSNTRSSRPQSAPGSRQHVNGNHRYNLQLQDGAPPMRAGNWGDSLHQGYSLPKSVGRHFRNQRSAITQCVPNTSGTLPFSASGRMFMESDRRFPDHFAMNSMKKGHYVGRSHHKSTSSRASSTSSMSSGFTTSHGIKPVHEEDLMYVL